MKIKKFEQFNSNNLEKESEDIEIFKNHLEKEEVEKLDLKEWEITKIIDIIKDPKDIEILEANAGFKLNTDLDVKDVKRGDVIYLTAMLAPKNKSTAYSPGTMGVLKCRISDIFFGLEKLKYLK